MKVNGCILAAIILAGGAVLSSHSQVITIAASTIARHGSFSSPLITWVNSRRSLLERFLQSDLCVDTASIEFIISTLGPSAFRGSLYRTAGFAFLLENSDGSIETLHVEIDVLADSLLFETFIYSTGEEGLGLDNFVQEDEYFGRNGEHTAELLGQHALLADFWQTQDSGLELLLVGLHSESLESSLELAIEAWAFENDWLDFYAITDDEILEAAASVREAIETELPNGYSNSVLSFDAYFISLLPFLGNNTAMIVIGDGYLDFDESLGLGEISNDMNHAHEYAHALQYIMDFDDAGRDYDVYAQQEYTTEDNRRYELEADAMAGYALAHEQGRNFSVLLLIASSRESFYAGDCDFTDADHHGTPLQRECATKWGADEGLDMTGEPVSMREFRTLFLENLDLILAIDPTVCQLTDDSVPVTPVTTTEPTTSPVETTVAPTATPATMDDPVPVPPLDATVLAPTAAPSTPALEFTVGDSERSSPPESRSPVSKAAKLSAFVGMGIVALLW